MTLKERITRGLKSVTAHAAAFVNAAAAAGRATREFHALSRQLALVTVPTHGYCTKCAVWLRLDIARGRCTVCFGKLTPME